MISVTKNTVVGLEGASGVHAATANLVAYDANGKKRVLMAGIARWATGGYQGPNGYVVTYRDPVGILPLSERGTAIAVQKREGNTWRTYVVTV